MMFYFKPYFNLSVRSCIFKFDLNSSPEKLFVNDFKFDCALTTLARTTEEGKSIFHFKGPEAVLEHVMLRYVPEGVELSKFLIKLGEVYDSNER